MCPCGLVPQSGTEPNKNTTLFDTMQRTFAQCCIFLKKA